MLWTAVSCVVALAVAWWAAFRIANRHTLQLCRAIPCAQPCYPVIGNLLLVACSLTQMTSNLLEIINKCVVDGQRAVCLWVGAYPLVFITNPDDIKKILNNSVGRGKELEASNIEYFKYGLLTAPVEHWKFTRRHLNPLFHPNNLEQLMPTFNSTSRQLVADLSKYIDVGALDLMPHVMMAALKAISTFIYGPNIVDLISVKELEDLRHAVELTAELMAKRMTMPWLNNSFLFKLLYGNDINKVKASFYKILQVANSDLEKRKLLKYANKFEEGVNNPGIGHFNSGFNCILDVMKELRDKSSYITEQHIMEEIISFFGTGTDTMGASVSSCLLALAIHPEIQDTVYAEISSVLSEDDFNDITYLNLKQFSYLDHVIKETLRLFLVVPFTSRATTKDIDLGGYTIPANKTVFLCVSGMGIDPKRFPDPYKFDPSRFSMDSPEECEYIPFSRGPRNCIGKEYAIMLIKVMVAHVVRKYILSTDMKLEEIKRKYMMTITSYDGYNVYLTKR